MNLLFSNDKRGLYPDSWYAATAGETPRFDSLRGATKADVCIIGGGYTGLSAALHLAQEGIDVVLLEAHRVGFGASGRNGGQLGSGQRQDQQTLEAMIGQDAAHRMWALGEDAKNLVRDLISKHSIDCALKNGVAWAASSPKSMRWTHDYAEHLAKNYSYPVETLDKAQFFDLCPSPGYHGGMLDMGAAHLHPLRLALGLARVAAQAGARIYERAHVHHVKPGAKVRIATDAGHVEADHVIFAANGYLGGLNRKVAARVMPINNFIVATEPLGDRAAEVLQRDIAVVDDKFVVNYFRLSDDKRLLFGGGESYGYRFPSDIRATVSKPMLQVFPGLAGVKLDFAWGGTLAITRKRLPHLARLAPNMISASGYSGHGVGNAIQAGQFLAQAIQGQSAGFDAFAALPSPRFPGGFPMRAPLLGLAMSWFAMRDRLGL